MPADLRQHRDGAEIPERDLHQRGRVHDLPRALPEHPEVHAIPAARISPPIPERSLSAQHALDRRPAGTGAVPDRGADGRGVVARSRDASWTAGSTTLILTPR